MSITVVYASPPLNLRLSPPDRTEGIDGNSDAYNTRIPVSLHRAGRVGRLEVFIVKFAGAIVVLVGRTAARSEHGAVERESDVVDLGTVLVL